jgi:hypothetical protein
LAVVEKAGEIQPLVFDSNHLTQAGELRVSELIKSEIN